MSIHKIVVTGGPCGGKTTALSCIQRDLSHLGYTVLIVPETATSLISGGVAPWTCGSNEEYQKCQMLLQLQKERIFEQAAATMQGDKRELAPYEIERKFLIEYPSLEWLDSLPNCERVEIVQTYMRSDPNEEIRIRRRGSGDHSMYYLTEKRLRNNRKQMRTQRRLTPGEYQMLKMQADPTCREIKKTRYCLTYAGQYFEIDVFPCWNDQAIVEIELSREDAPVQFPPELTVKREITGDPKYRNAVIASLPRGATQ